MHSIAIDPHKCCNDGACAAVCPADLIEYDGDLDAHTPIATAPERCIGCGHCLAVCPEGAVSVDGVAADACRDVDADDLPVAGQLDHLLRSRRSVRRYLARPVERDLLTRMLDTCRYAPTGSNRQQVAWAVADGRGRLQEIGQAMIEWLRQTCADETSIASRLPARWLIEGWESGRDPLFRGASTLVVNRAPKIGSAPYESALIAMTHLELLAAAAGLGACWIGFLMAAAQECPAVQELLGVPAGERLCGAMVIGYAEYPYRRVPPREPLRLTWI